MTEFHDKARKESREDSEREIEDLKSPVSEECEGDNISVSSHNESVAELQSTETAAGQVVDDGNSPLLPKDELLFMEYHE
jgi:hypothetical protein